jgi:hypothetical protein
MENLAVSVVNDGWAEKGVDERLLDLAKKYSASIATTDFNLNKVAQTMDIVVINVNELAQKLRLQFLPGETFEIKLSAAGQNHDQAVGYLDDGTMVVVDRAKSQIGKTIKVEAVRALQTEAGRMLFGKKLTTTREKNEYSRSSSRTNSSPRTPQTTAKPNYRKKISDYRPRSRRRQSPEDKLIDIANK